MRAAYAVRGGGASLAAELDARLIALWRTVGRFGRRESPFLVGAAAVLVALGILVAGRRHMAEAPVVHRQLQLAIDEEPAGAIALERAA